MRNLLIIFLYRCMRLIIMLLPSTFYGSLLLLNISMGLSCNTLYVLGTLIYILLIFCMLYGPLLINIEYDNTMWQLKYHKASKKEYLKSTIQGLPLVLLYVLTPIWLFLLYGMIQGFYIVADKEHKTIMERLYTTVETYIHNKQAKLVKN